MAAADSVQVLENDYVRRIHSKQPSGRLHRGHNITAATASIPSKYQTVVISNTDKKGFLGQARRFSHDGGAGENPGPGSYVSHGQLAKSTSSFSKKGTGGFASKDRRISKHQSTCSPGAGAYGLPTMLVTRKDYNQAGATSTFHLPIAVKRDEFSKLPAPNEYDLDRSRRQTNKSNNVTADAAFKSRTKREVIAVGDAKYRPAPWQYHVKDELTKDSVKVPFSSFKSTSVRRMAADPAPVPGPGTYKPHETIDPVQKTVFPRKHYLCISAPAMPLPSTPPLPGPGQYEVVNYDGPSKHYMSGAAFVSTTNRWTGPDNKTIEFPGPAHYRPAESGKQSFIYNAAGKWI